MRSLPKPSVSLIPGLSLFNMLLFLLSRYDYVMAKEQKKDGRPCAINNHVLRKLERVFAYGGTDAEAALYAGISESTLYDYCQKNPQFSERKKLLKTNPILKARKTIYKNLDQPATARWYLEKRARLEFGNEAKDENDQPPIALVKFIGERPKGGDHVR